MEVSIVFILFAVIIFVWLVGPSVCRNFIQGRVFAFFQCSFRGTCSFSMHPFINKLEYHIPLPNNNQSIVYRSRQGEYRVKEMVTHKEASHPQQHVTYIIRSFVYNLRAQYYYSKNTLHSKHLYSHPGGWGSLRRWWWWWGY